MITSPWRRPLVIGARGQVGTALTHALKSRGSSVLRSSRDGEGFDLALDLGHLREMEQISAPLDRLQPDAILCTGAMTWVDGCESRPEEAFAVHAAGPAMLAAYAQRHGLPFLLFSSDYVFPGSEVRPGPYGESAETEPLNVYGKTKLQGEALVQDVCPGALVLRTSWVYGPDPAGKNFISTLVRQLEAGVRVRVPEDQVSTPTWNVDLARAALELLTAGASGVVHVTGPELMSRADLARRVAAFFGLQTGLIEGIATAALGQTARRPLASGLRSERLRGLLPDFRFSTLQEGLRRSVTSIDGGLLHDVDRNAMLSR